MAKVVVILPAYNAARTLVKTYEDLPKDIIDDIILVDDASQDNTVEIAKGLPIRVFVHEKNRGYGANQKTCYNEAMKLGADIVVMVHPDHQYDPRVVPDLVAPLRDGGIDAVFGSRMTVRKNALEGGMPLWKFYANIFLTAFENFILGAHLTEYHSGFRAYTRRYLETVNYDLNSDDFVFDTEIIVQGLLHNMRIKEIPIKTRYFKEASMIGLRRSVLYGLGIVKTMVKYLLHVHGIMKFEQFKSKQ